MTRILTVQERQKIEKFSNSVSAVITPWQPTDSQNDRDSAVPGLIKNLLLKLVALSSNDHLVDYAESLKDHENQEEILSWLEAINALNNKMTKGKLFDQESLYSLYRNIYRVALYLGRDTNLHFAANALNVLSQLSQPLSKELLLAKVKPLITLFKTAQNNKPPKLNYYEPDYPAYISKEEIHEHLEPKRRPRLLYRTCSDTAVITKVRGEQHKKYDEVSPLKPRKLFAPLTRPH